MRRLVYTCVFGGYDWIFPPCHPEKDINYIVVCDDPTLRIPGWQTRVVDTGRFEGRRIANRYFKMLGHRELGEYDASLYIDGNVRLLGKTSEVFDDFYSLNNCLGLFRHPLRSTVQEEAETCLRSGKIKDSEYLEMELERYRQDGFSDDVGLLEAGIILKNHRHPDLDRTMECWLASFARSRTRDQISLPYVLWKTGAACMYQTYSFRDANPYFGLYVHKNDHRAPMHYAYVEGRAYDSSFYAAVLWLWRFSWSVRRAGRRGLIRLRSS